MKFPRYFKRSTVFLRDPWTSSLLLILVLLAVQLFFFRPYFLVNDDVFNTLMAKGVGLNRLPTEYFGVSNVLLGHLFERCFAWFPRLPWYGWFLCAVQALSLWVFLGLLRTKRPGWIPVLSFVIACLGVHFLFFTFLQFTMTSMMAAQAGLWLFLAPAGPAAGRRSVLSLAAAGSLLLLSSLIRLDAFLLMLLVSLPLWVFAWKGGKSALWTPPKRKFIALTVILVAACALFNALWSHRDSEWKEYARFKKALNELHQYRALEYSERTKPLFDSVGWSQNDFHLFRSWYFMDPEKCVTSKIEALNEGLPRSGLRWKRASFHSPGEMFGSFWDARILVFFFFFLLFCGAKEVRSLLVQCLWSVLVLLFLLYFMKATDRVTLPILAFLVHLAVHHSSRLPFGEGKRKFFLTERVRAWAGILLLAGAFFSTYPLLREQHAGNLERRRIESGMEKALDGLKPGTDRLYVMWDFPFELFNAFDDPERYRPYRLFVTSYFQRSPLVMETLREFGVKDLFRDMVDNPRIFLNCSREQGVLLHTYLQERYRLDIRAEKEFDGGFFKVYSIHSIGKKGR